MSKKVLVPIADGTEELEAITIIDVLRRAGAEVTVASVDGLTITSSGGIRIVSDILINDCTDSDWDLIVLPGGLPGAEHLRDCDGLTNLLKKQSAMNLPFAAICASPAIVLERHGLLRDRTATCYPSMQNQLTGLIDDGDVVIDGNCVTSRGPGTAMQFSLALVELLFGASKAKSLATIMLTDFHEF